MVVGLERAVEERLEEGLRAIEEQAAALMREIAMEMWRTSGAETSNVQDRILSFLSRDQAIRSLIASSDERFQTLAVRTARFEDVLTDVAEASRTAKEAIQQSARAIHEVAESPAIHGVEAVRSQLEMVERHIATAFEHIDERDQALVDGIQSRIQEHGELIARETTRIVEAMQGYVQSGTETVGRLAMRVEGHAEAFAVHDTDVADELRQVIRQEIGGFVEQFDLTGERVGIQQRDAAAAVERMQQSIESRVYGLAQLIRSDSEALRRHVDQTAAEQQERLASIVDERTAGLSGAILERMADVAPVSDGTSSMELERNLEERNAALEERLAAHVDDRIGALAKLMRADNRVIAEHLAAAGTGGDAETSRQTLRAMKELQASLAGEVDSRFQTMAEQLHRESQSTVETMAKVAEVLASKMDRISVRIDEGYGNDLQVVVERMSDAIAAISGIGRNRAV
jgi:hypothetical protein